MEDWQQESVKLHTLSTPVHASDGVVTDYIDGIGMIICAEWKHDCYKWVEWFEDKVGGVYVVGMGQAGAAIVSHTGGLLIRAPYKQHGPEYNGQLPAPGTEVCLVDDVAVTGQSLNYMHEWCEKRGLVVKQEVVMVDKRTDNKEQA